METKIKQTSETPFDSKQRELGFTIEGKPIDTDSQKCYAKSYDMSNGRTDYYVKTNVTHIIVDPFNQEHVSNLERTARRTGSPSSSFESISKNGFEAYVQYLTTKNPIFYRRSSRELLVNN